MKDQVSTALELARGMRRARGVAEMAPAARRAFLRDLDRIESTLTSGGDGYAQVLDVLDLESRLRGRSGSPSDSGARAAPPGPPQPPPAVRQRARLASALARRSRPSISRASSPRS
jgi:hypothetical protein